MKVSCYYPILFISNATSNILFIKENLSWRNHVLVPQECDYGLGHSLTTLFKLNILCANCDVHMQINTLYLYVSLWYWTSTFFCHLQVVCDSLLH